jgi:hypothetical protein
MFGFEYVNTKKFEHIEELAFLFEKKFLVHLLVLEIIKSYIKKSWIV